MYSAISALSDIEEYGKDLILYCGLHKVQLSTKEINLCYFPTYVSASYNKAISMQFAQNNGMLMQMSSDIINSFKCCSVEWLSKFDYECEVLIARSKEANSNAVKMQVTDYEKELNCVETPVQLNGNDKDSKSELTKRANVQVVNVTCSNDKCKYWIPADTPLALS